jgi:hypothetical protein
MRKPAEIAEAFVADMRAFFAEPNPIKRDEIAIRQMSVLRQYQGPREKPGTHSRHQRDVSADEGQRVSEVCY